MASGMLSNRNEDESSQQTNSNSSEFMNCPQCQLEFNSPQVCQHVNYFNYFLSFHMIFIFFFFCLCKLLLNIELLINGSL